MDAIPALTTFSALQSSYSGTSWNQDPFFRAVRNRRVVGPGAWAEIPIFLRRRGGRSRGQGHRRRLLHDDRGLLHDDRRLLHDDRGLVHEDRGLLNDDWRRWKHVRSP